MLPASKVKKRHPYDFTCEENEKQDERQNVVKNALKLTVIWTLNCLVFARLNIIIKKNRGVEAIEDQWSIIVLSTLFLLAKLIETDQGKDAYIVFLFFILLFLNIIE